MKAPNKWVMAAVVVVGPTLALDTTIVTTILSQSQKAFNTDFWNTVFLINGPIVIVGLLLSFLVRLGRKSKPVQAPCEVHSASTPNVISTLTANGKEIIGSELLLWHHPENNIVNGSLLTVANNHFCVLKLQGMPLKVYETGRYTIQPPDHPLFGSVRQLAFSGEPITWQYEALCINHARIPVKASGIALSQEMVHVDYSVDYSIHIASSEDAVQLIQSIPYHGPSLSVQEVGEYAWPIIEETVNQQVLATPLEQTGELQMQDLSQQVHHQLQKFLSSYGITLDAVKVLLSPRNNKRSQALLPLKAFNENEWEAVHCYPATTNNATGYDITHQLEPDTMYFSWHGSSLPERWIIGGPGQFKVILSPLDQDAPVGAGRV